MKVIFFDIDHTLTASPKGVNGESSRLMFQEVLGINATEDSVEKVGMTEWGLLEKVVTQFPESKINNHAIRNGFPDEIGIRWAEILEELLKGKLSTLLPGMWEILVEISNQKDMKLALLTGNSYWRSEVKLKAVGLDEFFRDRTGRLRGAFGNEARTREGLIAFAQDRFVYDHDTMSVVDDSLIGANMVRGRRDVFGIFVATGSATQEQLNISGKPVFKDLDEDRWKVAFELLKRYG